MRKILFNDFEFSDGVNTTVRRGLKLLSPGDLFYVSNTSNVFDENAMQLVAASMGCIVMAFKEIPEAIISLQHSENTRTRTGLLKVLKECYEDFTENEIVTIIFFKIK